VWYHTLRKENDAMTEATPLPIRHDLTLHPTPPFNFDGTVHKPSYFPSSDTAYERGVYWQTMRFEGRLLGLRMADQGSLDHPQVRLTIYATEEIPPDALQRIAAEVEYRYDTPADLTGFYRRCAADELLGPVLARWRGMRVSNYTSLYEFLVIATVLQNATVRRSAQMLENLFARYGSRVTYDGKRLSAYWPPEAIHQAGEEELRALKVGYRAKSLKRQAQAFAPGELDEFQLRTLPAPELKAALLRLYGVGPASVWYLLFGVFKRYDAFEHISPWEQKIYSRLLFNQELVDSQTILAEVDARWGEWKMLAAHYLFEDLFWQRQSGHIPWLEKLIRL
jgi:3-methyladenine DNA glycosylase/8-oxoguanine DNA glycosylase